MPGEIHEPPQIAEWPSHERSQEKASIGWTWSHGYGIGQKIPDHLLRALTFILIHVGVLL